MAGLPEAGDEYGRYRLLSELSRGEAQRVFVASATDAAVDAEGAAEPQVVLKVVLPAPAELDELRERLIRGAAQIGKVRSRHVADVADVGQHDDTVFVATQYFEVGDLATRLRSQGHLSRSHALRLVAAICQGLDDAERAGVAHGNLKPSNILLSHDEEGLHPYVSDFAATSPRGGSLPRAGAAADLLAYVAPETLLGRTSDVRSDIYSVGCILWSAVSGQAPYGGSAFQVMQGHVRGDIPQVHVKDRVDQALNDLISFTLAKDPVDRVQRLSELRDACLSLAEGHLPHEAEEADEEAVSAASEPAPVAPAPGAVGDQEPEAAGAWWTRTNLKVVAGFAAGLLIGGTATALLSGSDDAEATDRVAVSADVSPSASPTPTPSPSATKKPKPPKKKPKPKPEVDPASAQATGLTGDYTGDGFGDLLLTRRDGVPSTVLLTSEKDSFQARDLSTLGFSESRTVRGDFNGDGNQDLLELAPQGVNTQVRLWASDGAAPITPSPWRSTNLMWSGLTVTAGDVNGDDADDLVSETATELQATPLAGDGPLTATTWGTRAVPTLVEGIVSGDFDGDGTADVIEYADNGAGVTLYFHRSNGGGFDPPKEWGKFGDWRLQSLDLLVGDFDGDGTADLAAVPKPEGGSFQILVLRSNGDGLGKASAWTSSGAVSWDATRIVAGDFDGDGRTDVASLEQKPQGLSVGVRRSVGSEFDSVSDWAELPNVPWSRDAAAGLGR